MTDADRAAGDAKELSQAETRPLANLSFVRPRGIATEGRRQVRWLVSYDDSDTTLVARFLELFEKTTSASRVYEHRIWHRGKVLPGESPQHRIAEEFAASDAVLVLLSPGRIRGGEEDIALSTIAGAAKVVIPVALCTISDRQKNDWLRSVDIFGAEKSFDKCQTQPRADFVLRLFDQLEERLDGKPPVAKAAFDEAASRELMFSFDRSAEALDKYIRSRGAAATLADNHAPQASSPDNTVDMLETLLEWAANPRGERYAAILGEYGMGKTTLLRKLTEELLRRRDGDPAAPLPIFIDLRGYSETIQKEGRVPERVEVLLRDLLARAWRSERAIDPAGILRLVREERAILIFDGLDEKLTHLDEAQGQAFIRTLWQALPPALPRAGDAPQPADGAGRLVFSCRSHYFKTLSAQRSLLLGEDREGLRPADYRAWVLLPFTEEQIRQYLAGMLDPSRVDAVMQLFEDVHNLRDLVQRPYLLFLVTGQIEALEQKRLRGEAVAGVTIYQQLVERWLERDNGKHKLRPEDKVVLMEEIAAAMWTGGERSWGWERLRDWLGARLAGDAVLRARYERFHTELLEEDLRTATFILRPDGSERDFRFAHTSMLEFFLAAHLLRALAGSDSARWAAFRRAMPSPETFDFLGQLLAVEPDPSRRKRCLESLSAILEGGPEHGAEVAFRYWVRAAAEGLPEPQPSRIDLRAADLAGWEVEGRAGAPRLNLRGADLSGADLTRSVWRRVDLSGASLVNVRAHCAELLETSARGIDVAGADFAGAVWRRCDADGLTGAAAAGWYDCMWIDSELDPAALPPDFRRHGSLSIGANVRVPDGALQAVATLASGHSGEVTACAWSPDGSHLASGSDDGTVKVWDARSGREILSLSGHSDTVTACTWSPDGSQLASASVDRTVKVWDARSGREILSLSGHSTGVYACAWSPDGSQLASASVDRTVKVWDARSGREILSLSGHSSGVTACAWSPDGSQLASGSHDRTVKVWDARSGREILSLSGHSSWVTACTWSPDGSQLASGSRDDTVKVWDARSGREILSLSGHSNGVTACAWSPDGSQLASGSRDDTVKVWDARSGREILSLSGHSSWVTSCAWSPDGSQLASGSHDRTVKVWDARCGHEILSLSSHSHWVTACAWDGSHLASGSSDGTVKVWDARSGREILSLSGHSHPVTACAWSPDGSQLAAGSYDRTVKVWDARSGREILSLSGHSSWVTACAWSPDGSQLASGSSDDTVKVWDARFGREILSLSGHSHPVTSCAWSPDGSQLASASYDRTVKVWDARFGREILSLSGHSDRVTACAWSPGGSQLASASYDGTVKVWDARTGREILSLSGHSHWVTACAWSPDGSRLASGSFDSTVKVWDARSGREILSLSGHSAPVSACTWSPDGSQLASGSDDRTVKVWDARTGRHLKTCAHLPGYASATIDVEHNAILWASKDAWRYLGWRTYDETAGRWRLLPAEHFGPLPGLDPAS